MCSSAPTIFALSLDGAVLRATSTLSLGEVAPHEHTIAPYYLHTFSGQGSPDDRYYSILLALYSLQMGEPLVCTNQWVLEAAPAGSTSG